MTLSRLLAVVALALAMIGSIVAQDQEPPRYSVLVQLKLSDEQWKDIRKIQADFDAKIKPLVKQKWELWRKEKAELEALLTDEQKAKLKQINLGKVLQDEPKKP